MQALVGAGIEVEVIPGITAGLGVPATLGIPVTHRSLARGVTFVTAHTRDGAEPNWDALVRSAATLVIYMGIAKLEHIVRQLADAGMSPAMPACVVQDGTLGTQRQVVGTLATITKDAAAMRIASPALIVIGEVVRFAQASSGSVPELRVA